ncbi:helix-turn-helix domain-containing protein [Streptomyces himastatinicus]|uniref:helix-turn-helix domain-containing protein n=1 Tax=Streptomyces himastatinicus TaxID=998084 RepID=UPI000587B7ED|nr:LysR family transcriptional regulator [Streptomyces himastatinicus]
MAVRQLKALVTVAEAGSVTRAAELLHLVQPAVTRQIRMVDRARRALNELERARAEVRPTPGVGAGIVTVGLLESTTDLLAEPLVPALALDQPGIDLRLMTAYSGHLQQWLDDGDLDLTLLYNLASTPDGAAPLCEPDVWRSIVLGTSRAGRTPPAVEVVARELIRHTPRLDDATRKAKNT